MTQAEILSRLASVLAGDADPGDLGNIPGDSIPPLYKLAFDAITADVLENGTVDAERILSKANGQAEPLREIFVELLDRAAADVPPILDPSDPMPAARLLLQSRHSRDGKPILGYHRGTAYRWDGKSYRPEGDAEIECGAWGYLEGALRRVKVKEEWSIVPFKPNRARVGDVLAALRAVANIPSEIEPPAWISTGAAATDLLPMQNGILDLRDGKLLPSSPDLFAIGAVDYDYDPKAECPNWHRFLNDLLDDDLERRDLLADWFGYALTADTRQQKILLIVGPKRSGKGTIARVLSGVVGSENVCNPTAASLGTHFGLVPLIGKRLAIIGDARMGGNTDSYLLAERLLSISGEDGITIDRKFREEWTGRLGVRFVILSNELPRFADPSGAIASRFLILPLEESFLGREDETLTERLLGERAGILNWALAGLARLRERRHFLQPSAAAEMIREVEDLSSPVAAFIRDKVERGPVFEVEVGALHNAYLAWCASMGREYKEHVQGFARDFRAAWEGKLRTKRPRWGGERTRVYCGLRLKP